MSCLHPILNLPNSCIIKSGLESASCYGSIGIVLEMRGKFVDMFDVGYSIVFRGMLDDIAKLTHLSNLGEKIWDLIPLRRS